MTTEPQTPRAPRFEVHLGAELRVEGKILTATTRNLSEGGVCLQLDRPLKEATTLRVSLYLVEEGVETEGARPLELDATVEWVAEADSGNTAGLKFPSLSPTQRSGLKVAPSRFGEA